MTTTAPPQVPYTIRAILDQLGRGLNGAIVYTGGRNVLYSCPPSDHENRSSHESHQKDGMVHYDVGLSFKVNGQRQHNWHIIVAYEPDDTYTVWLWSMWQRDGERHPKVLAEVRDVYCDTLKDTVERVYDEAIKEHCDGFIPLS